MNRNVLAGVSEQEAEMSDQELISKVEKRVADTRETMSDLELELEGLKGSLREMLWMLDALRQNQAMRNQRKKGK